MNYKIQVLLSAILLMFTGFNSKANNVRINNVNLVNDSTINFSISWDNSWKSQYAPANNDAVWIFIKKRDCASLQWSHVDLSKNVAEHSAGEPLTIAYDNKDVTTNAKGIYVQRANVGAGNINEVSVTLRMKGAVSGEFDFKIFGIEMVYAPEGSFFLGDGSSTDYGFGTYVSNGVFNPFKVTSEAALVTATSSTSTYYNRLFAGGYNVNNNSIPLAYPKGFKAFYAMKYELTQGQYVDFLNCLQSDQAALRYRPNTDDYGINYAGEWPEISTKFPYRAAGFLSWQDLLAYLDWACLRPMTEFEYEKLSRGPLEPVTNEFAWGSTSITAVVYPPVNVGMANESASNTASSAGGLANCQGTIAAPLRSGFAAKPGTTRYSSGAGYYGAMELTGNVHEYVVGIQADGRTYSGNVGDGEITGATAAASGLANVTGWPSSTSCKMVRGGSFSDGSLTNNLKLRVACRNPAASGYVTSDPSTRYNVVGGRGVR